MKRTYHWLNHVLNFLAVILGVYLAFYINERAKVNQDRRESRLLMNSLLEDLSEDIRVYEEYQIPANTQIQQNVESLLNLLSADKPKSVDSQLPTILQVENYAPATSTYSSMKAAGKLGLMDDLALQKALVDYYEVLVPESEAKGKFQVDYFTNELLTWLTNNVDLLEMKVWNERGLIVLRNKLIIYESLIDQKVKAYQMIVEDSRQLKQRIESTLESN